MTIQLIADDGTTVLGRATIPQKTGQVLAAAYGDVQGVLSRMLTGAYNVIDDAVAMARPDDVAAAAQALADAQAMAQANVGSAQAAVVTASHSYRAVQD